MTKATSSIRARARLRLPGMTALLFAAIVAAAQGQDPRSSGSGPAERQVGRAQATVDPDGYTSAHVCGDCHEDIYRSWKNSMHAFSLTDPIFDASYMQALREVGDEARRLCLSCHAPMTIMNEDWELQLGVTREGVSCDFCHTVTAVHLGDPAKPYSLEPGIVKRGIIKKAETPAHEVAYSELHGKSEFCGGCHNLIGASGVPLLTTYDEWRDGPYSREGVQCQDCHMVLSSGNVVSERIKKSGSEIHMHDLIHDSTQLRGALAMQITATERSGDNMRVSVEIENVGSGHMVPTGMPTREVLLSVQAQIGSRIVTQERSFRKVIADENMQVLESDVDVMLRGTRVLNDNRIAPREKRLERLNFHVPQRSAVKVTATLSYVYTPTILKQERLNIELARSERSVY